MENHDSFNSADKPFLCEEMSAFSSRGNSECAHSSKSEKDNEFLDGGSSSEFSSIKWRGQVYSVDLDSQTCREKFKGYLEEQTGEEWGIFKEETGNENWVFYQTRMYEEDPRGNGFIHVKEFAGAIELPINASSCCSMFSNMNLQGISFENFDTSEIVDMAYMFYHSVIPPECSLGDNFYTNNVVDMCSMFCGSRMYENFSLGDHFDTSKVQNMSAMFAEGGLAKGLSLGDHFCTSNVTDMSYMFIQDKIPAGFGLGDHFDTSKVIDMRGMFRGSLVPEDFSIGKHFDISGVKYTDEMFRGSLLPEDKVGNDFDCAEDIVKWLKNRESNDWWL